MQTEMNPEYLNFTGIVADTFNIKKKKNFICSYVNFTAISIFHKDRFDAVYIVDLCFNKIIFKVLF